LLDKNGGIMSNNPKTKDLDKANLGIPEEFKEDGEK